MTILFLHGWQSVPGGVKPTYLKDHGHTVINPELPDEDFEDAVRIAQAEFDKHRPEVVVGSSRGGAVAININSGDARLVLLCPAWKKWGTAKTVRASTVILHSRADDVVPFADSEELAKNSGAALIEVGTDHRLAEPEPLLAEERSLVDPSVLDSYELAFHQRLEELIQRTKAPDLRAAFEDMRRCPIKNMAGKCSRFVDYIVSALVRSACHRQYDIEGSLQRIVFKMIGKTGERALPHKGVFDFDEFRPYYLRLGNPVQVMFKKYLSNEIRAITMNCIPSLRTIQHPGRFSIGQGSEDTGMVSQNSIPDRPQSHEPEMMNDLIELLRKQSTPNLHLVDLFYSILNKEGPGVQSTRFGTSQVARGKLMIVKIIEQYAQSTQNWHMLRLLDRFRERFPKRFEEPGGSKKRAGSVARL